MRYIVVAIILSLPACGPSVEDVVKKHRAGAEKQLASLAAIGKAATQVAPLSADQVSVADTELVIYKPGIEDWNTLVVPIEQLADPSVDYESETLELTSSFHHRLGDCIKALANQDKTLKADRVAKSCAALERLSYVLVVRANIRMPMLGVGDFSPGVVRGDVLLYALDGTRSLGGYRYSATNGDEILSTRGDPAASLKSDLEMNWSVAVHVGATEHIEREQCQSDTDCVPTCWNKSECCPSPCRCNTAVNVRWLARSIDIYSLSCHEKSKDCKPSAYECSEASRKAKCVEHECTLQ